MLRIKPGVDAHTHSFIRTGQIDSKFGFALETGEALGAVKLALDIKVGRRVDYRSVIARALDFKRGAY